MMRREYKQKQVFHEIKDIFYDSFTLPEIDEDKPIIEKLLTIVVRINDEDLDKNVKILEWSKRKFYTKVLEKISRVITLR